MTWLLVPILIIAMAFTIFSFSVNSQEELLDQYQVIMMNNLVGKNLTLHCHSNTGHDLAVKDIKYGGCFNWTGEIIMEKPEIYICDLMSGNLRGRFVIFVSYIDYFRCGYKKCIWIVVSDGLYLYNEVLEEYFWEYGWQLY